MASKRKTRQKSPPKRRQRPEQKSQIERGFEDFGEEMEKLGERIGEAFEKRGKEWERKGVCCESWFHQTFGLTGPFLSSIFGIIVLSLLIWLIAAMKAGVQSGFLYNIQVFLSGNVGLFFIIFLFFSYSSYFSKAYTRAYKPVSPIFTAAGFTIGFWIAARALAIANISIGMKMLSDIADYIDYNLMLIFWILLVLGYVVLIVKSACEKAHICKISRSAPARKKTYQAAPESAAGGVRRLYRSGNDRILGGVCGGIAEYLGVDPVLIRILLIIGTLAWGFGILLYIILWIIIPRNPKHKWD